MVRDLPFTWYLMRDLTELIRTLESNRACLELGITGAGGHEFSVHSRAELRGTGRESRQELVRKTGGRTLRRRLLL